MSGWSGSSLNDVIYYESSGYGLDGVFCCDFEGFFDVFG